MTEQFYVSRIYQLHLALKDEYITVTLTKNIVLLFKFLSKFKCQTSSLNFLCSARVNIYSLYALF